MPKFIAIFTVVLSLNSLNAHAGPLQEALNKLFTSVASTKACLGEIRQCRDSLSLIKRDINILNTLEDEAVTLRSRVESAQKLRNNRAEVNATLHELETKLKEMTDGQAINLALREKVYSSDKLTLPVPKQEYDELTQDRDFFGEIDGFKIDTNETERLIHFGQHYGGFTSGRRNYIYDNKMISEKFPQYRHTLGKLTARLLALESVAKDLKNFEQKVLAIRLLDYELYQEFKSELLSKLILAEVTSEQEIEGLRWILAADILRAAHNSGATKPSQYLAEIAPIFNRGFKEGDQFTTEFKDILLPLINQDLKILAENPATIQDFVSVITSLGPKFLADHHIEFFAKVAEKHPEILDDPGIIEIFKKDKDLMAKLQSLVLNPP